MQRDCTRKPGLESLKVTLSILCLKFFTLFVCIGFTGIDQSYEAPEKPDLVLKGGQWSVDDSLSKLVEMLRRQVGIILIFCEYLSLLVALLQHIIPIDSKQTLEELFVSPERLEEVMEEAEEMPKLTINKLDLQWVQVCLFLDPLPFFHTTNLQVLSEGWAMPLKGFMREREYLQCLHFATLLDGGVVSQSVPIVLPVTDEEKEKLEEEEAIALVYEGRIVAVMRSPEFFPHRKEERCSRQFGTTNKGHPYIKVCLQSS